MNIIINANKEQFEEAKPMCEAIRELFKDEFDKIYEEFDRVQEEYKSNIATEKEKSKAEGIDLGIEQGIISTIDSCKTLGASIEQTIGLLIKNFNMSEENAKMHIKKYW